MRIKIKSNLRFPEVKWLQYKPMTVYLMKSKKWYSRYDFCIYKWVIQFYV